MIRPFVILLFLTGLLSDGATLEFSGLKTYTRGDLIDQIAGRLEFIQRGKATDYRADDAAFLVESYLRLHGLPDATVSGEVISAKRIKLTVDEGLAQFLGPITIKGAEKPEAIEEQFRAPFPESGKRRAFQAEAVESGLARVRDLLHADGYWKGSATSQRGARNAQSEIPFTLTVAPGILFTLAPVELKSPVEATADLQEKLLRQTGKTATAEAINSIRNTISESYRRRGYSDISVEISNELLERKLKLFVTVVPGKKFTVRSFQTAGLQKTQKSRIQNRFDDLVGKNYDEDRINTEIEKLLTTGAFEGIRLETVESPNNTVDLTLHLKESKARGYSFALGYGSIEGYVVGARYYDRNLWGRLWNLSAGIELTGLGVLGEVSLTNPYFLNKELNLANRAFLITRDFKNYTKLQGGFGSELSWKRGDHYSAALGFEISQTSIDSPLPKNLIGPDDYFVNRISFRQLYDRRNDPALPSDGWYARLENSIGLAAGEGAVGFFQTEAQVSFYKTIGEKNALNLGLRGGWILPTENEENLPIDLRKFLGGANTIRSFPELEMGPSFANLALGGTAWWVANAEFTRSLVGPVKGLLFVDAAGLDSETDMAVGVGVRIDLPVGPIRLEYGHSLSRDPGEPSGAFHFAIGTTF